VCLARRAFFFFEKKESKKTFSEQSPLKNFDFGILDVKKWRFEILQRTAQKLLGTNTIYISFRHSLKVNTLVFHYL
jgi:hypothetical protein